MRECNEHEITIERLLNIVHNYTDPIRIQVIMSDAWLTCEEAKNMHDFLLTKKYCYRDTAETERLLKYYKDVPVWNLHVWMDETCLTMGAGRAVFFGIQANCHYKDIREGYLAEKADLRRAKQKAYRQKRKATKEGRQDNG